MDIFNNTIDAREYGGVQQPKMSYLKRINTRRSILIERRSAIPVHTLVVDTTTC